MRHAVESRWQARFAVAGATIALSFAGSVASASAQVAPGGNITGQQGAGVGTAGCVGQSRPSVVGGGGSAGDAVCGGVTIAFIGPAIGQVSSAIGPTIIGAAPVILAPIGVSNGGLQQSSVP
jgi:hypothetical protein